MAHTTFRINSNEEYQKAGASDLIELDPTPHGNPLFVRKSILETFVAGIAKHEFVHLSGPTGSAKSSLIEALYLADGNFKQVCSGLGLPFKRIILYPVEMAVYETPGELYQRRSLKGGRTYDEKSRLVNALIDANKRKKDCYPLIWLREMGRVHSPSVQGGLLNLMTHEDIVLPDGVRIKGEGIGWVADSNYQAEHDSTHTLVTLDDALKRRFTLNITLDYLSAELEIVVLESLLKRMKRKPDLNLLTKVVHLGQAIRRYRSEGNLLSVVPPSIYGYLAFIRQTEILPHQSIQDIALSTLLGNASSDDQKHIPGLFHEVFGLQVEDEELSFGANAF